MDISDSAKKYILENREYAKPLLGLLNPSYKGWIYCNSDGSVGRRDVLNIDSKLYDGETPKEVYDVLATLASLGVLAVREISHGNYRFALKGELIDVKGGKYFFDPDHQKRKDISDVLAKI
jgi:hypothetical protein